MRRREFLGVLGDASVVYHPDVAANVVFFHAAKAASGFLEVKVTGAGLHSTAGGANEAKTSKMTRNDFEAFSEAKSVPHPVPSA